MPAKGNNSVLSAISGDPKAWAARLDLIRAGLNSAGSPVWDEPFHEAWVSQSPGTDRRIRLARAQAAEMANVRPFIKAGELIVGNCALRSFVSCLPAKWVAGIRLDMPLFDKMLEEHPDRGPRLREIKTYWNSWMAENEYLSPMQMHASLAYDRILEAGVEGMREQVLHWRAINAAGRPDCGPWYDALLIMLDGISAYVEAHAAAAGRASSETADPARRAELGLISRVCRRIAKHRPASFHETVQLYYLLFQLCGHDSPGPIDRTLYPSFKRDIERGLISEADAQCLVDCLWLKFEEKQAFGATLAGRRPDGSGAGSRLTWLCLDAIARLRLLSPRTAFRWHPGISRDLFDKACASVVGGAAFPSFINDEALIPAMVMRGVAPEHAPDFTFVGCGQTYPHGRGHGNYEDVIINAPKALELALNNGRDPVSGKQWGAMTGEPSEFDEYGQFESAYRRQMRDCIAGQIGGVNAHRARTKDRVFSFLRSLLSFSCIERGLDWHAGGAEYSEGMVDLVGLTTVTDSLFAIRQVVYRDRRLTLSELVGILNRNWQDHEPLRQYMLRRVDKFGNDRPDVDLFTAAEVRGLNDFIRSHRTALGGPWGMDIIGWSGSVEFGGQTGATPDGRRRGEPLADCAGPAQGRNLSGLAATLRSASRLPHAECHGPLALSLRFPPATVRCEGGTSKLGAMIETYFKLGGQHLQISVAGAKEMKEAQKWPERHGSLIVRVGGFNAYFVALEKRFQDDMIARTELAME